MLDFFKSAPDETAIIVAIIALVGTIIVALISYFTSKSVQNTQTEQSILLQELTEKRQREGKKADEASASLKIMLVVLQQFRASVKLHIKAASIDNVDADDVADQLSEQLNEIESAYANVLANCKKTDDQVAHRAKNLSYAIKDSFQSGLENSNLNLLVISSMLEDLRDEQDTIRDSVAQF